MSFQIRYRADTDLGRRFPHMAYPWKGDAYPTRQVAEDIMRACASAASMEIVEVEA